ncbi:MAG: hypothetical protein A2583_14060 [Bdellovibrionales bacterium RIFOXYD1_FULL_53_11]|nr:MAG: hypothetical protein A2583_14060 [Bdellovibrionales bacterium RIFOXYD1_FULL_53_11]
MPNYPKTLYLLMVLCLFSIPVFGVETKVGFEKHIRYLVVFVSENNAAILQKKLPQNCTVLSFLEKFNIVDCFKGSDADYKKIISGIHGTIAVERDRKTAYSSPDDKNCKDCKGNDDNKAGQKPLQNLALGIANKVQCDLFGKCELNNNTIKRLAQENVDAEQMKQYVRKEIAGRKIPVKVAVVDSGFDKARINTFDTDGVVKVFPGVVPGDNQAASEIKLSESEKKIIVGSTETDELGHGTMVASVIAGKDGVGVSDGVSLHVYRALEANLPVATSFAINIMSAYKACINNNDPAGVTLINMSLGDNSDEAGRKRLEDDAVVRNLMRKFAENGCLLVMAAGNGGFKQNHKSDLNDPLLRVAAVDSYQKLADFSSKGEVSAPGTNVSVIGSTSITRIGSTGKKCGKNDSDSNDPRGLVDGTSFAAPITTGVAAMVVRMLKSGDVFGKLIPAKRISLVNRILKASELYGSINGLRAVAIANRWNKLGAFGRMMEPFAPDGVAKLTSYLTEIKDPHCGKNSIDCSRKNNCSETKSCFERERAGLVLCPDNRQNRAYNLAKTAITNGFHDVARKYLGFFSNDDAQKNKYFELLDELVEHENNEPLNSMAFEIAPYMKLCSEKRTCNEQKIKKIFSRVVENHQIDALLLANASETVSEDRGSSELLNVYLNTIEYAKAVLDLPFIEDKILHALNNSLKETTARPENRFMLPGLARKISALIELRSRIPFTENFRKTLASLEDRIFKDVIDRNDYFSDKITFSNVNPSRASFDGMLARRWEGIVKIVESGQLGNLAPLQVHYLIKKMNSDPILKNKGSGILLGLLREVSSRGGWGTDNDKDIFEKIVKIFGADKTSMSYFEMIKIIESGTKYAFLYSIIDNEGGSEYGANTATLLQICARKTALAMLDAKSSDFSMTGFPLSSKKILELLMNDKTSHPQVVVYGEWQSRECSRLTTCKTRSASQYKGDVDLGIRFMEWMMSYAINTENDYESPGVLKSVLSVLGKAEKRKYFRQSKTWIKTAMDLLEDAKKHPDKYVNDSIKMLTSIVDGLK